MKNTILKAVPILMVAAILVLILYFTGLFGIEQQNSLLQMAIWLLIILYAFSTLMTVAVLIYERGHPAKTLAWIVVLFALPGLGIIFYTFFGAHFKAESSMNDKTSKDAKTYKKWKTNYLKAAHFDEEAIAKKWLAKELHPAIKKCIQYMLHNHKALLSEKNKLQVLNDGKATYDSIFKAIEAATHHVHLEYYIWTEDELGQKLKKLLIQKAEEGVEIRVIIDGIGSVGLSNSYLKEMQEANIEVTAFRPLRFAIFNSKSNFRNHRKIVIVDGKIGFTGGINIDGKYLDDTTPLGHWRDTHLRLEGDAVKGLQMTFASDWAFLVEDRIKGDDYFPKVNVRQESLCHIIAAGPDTEWDGVKQMYLYVLHNATDYVYIATPYLAPDETVFNAFKSAACSGVDIHLMLPEQGDSKVVQMVSDSYLEELLTMGVQVYKYQKGFLHSKIMLADGAIGTVGSSNLDSRSFDQNLEINAVFYDPPTLKQLKKTFQQNFKECRQLKLSEFEKANAFDRFVQGTCRLLSPLM